MQDKVVRLHAGMHTAALHEDEQHSSDDHIREYILDMVRQLASLAEAQGEPLLGLMLEEINHRYDLPSRQETHPPATTPGRVI